MQDHTKLMAFELADEAERLDYIKEQGISGCKLKLIETKKVFGTLIRTICNR